jgi:hypothetical protein
MLRSIVGSALFESSELAKGGRWLVLDSQALSFQGTNRANGSELAHTQMPARPPKHHNHAYCACTICLLACLHRVERAGCLLLIWQCACRPSHWSSGPQGCVPSDLRVLSDCTEGLQGAHWSGDHFHAMDVVNSPLSPCTPASLAVLPPSPINQTASPASIPRISSLKLGMVAEP